MKNLIIVLFLGCAINLHAQYVRPSGETSTPPSPATNPSFWDNVSAGGSFQLQFGDYTYVGLEPLMNYHFNSSFMVGLGPIYQYLSVNDPNYNYYYKASIYGGRISAMYFLPDELSRVFLMGEYDIINIPEEQINIYGYPTQTRGNLELPLLGLGYKEPVNDRVFFTIYGLWSFNNSIYSPYTNPIINFGFDVGL